MTPATPTPPAGYRLRAAGEQRKPGDLAWTWTTPECSEVGWTPVMEAGIIDDGHVPVATKEVP